MPKVMMTKTTMGSPDGIMVKQYLKGTDYLLPEKLAAIFIKNNFAAAMEEELPKVVEKKKEEKSAGAAPKNKMMESPSDKEEDTTTEGDKGKK